jgi:hypothetical protein
VQRHLERVSLFFSSWIGRVISDVDERQDSAAKGRVREISASSTGLNWISGSASRRISAVGLEADRQAAYGGPVVLSGNGAGGFAFPVPLDALGVHGKPTATLHALTRAGQLRRLRD